MNEPALPAELIVVVRAGGAPVRGAWVAVTLPMKAKNPYRLLFGPASVDGEMRIRREALEHEVSRVRDLFLMDYCDPSGNWTGEVIVQPLNRSDIANVPIAYDVYGETGFYPAGLTEMLAELDGLLADLDSGSLDIQVSEIGGDGARVVARTRPID